MNIHQLQESVNSEATGQLPPRSPGDSLTPSPLLSEKSPHLAAVVQRRFGKFSEGHVLISKAFLFSLQGGGSEEIDFRRAPDVSFNPRAARMGLEALKADPSISPRFVSAVILGAAEESALRSLSETELGNEPNLLFAASVALQSLSLPIHAFLSIDGDTSDEREKGASLAFLVSLLDRIRHLHLAEKPRIREVLPGLVGQLEFAEQLSAFRFPSICPLFAHWKMRVLPRLGSL